MYWFDLLRGPHQTTTVRHSRSCSRKQKNRTSDQCACCAPALTWWRGGRGLRSLTLGVSFQHYQVTNRQSGSTSQPTVCCVPKPRSARRTCQSRCRPQNAPPPKFTSANHWLPLLTSAASRFLTGRQISVLYICLCCCSLVTAGQSAAACNHDKSQFGSILLHCPCSPAIGRHHRRVRSHPQRRRIPILLWQGIQHQRNQRSIDHCDLNPCPRCSILKGKEWIGEYPAGCLFVTMTCWSKAGT